MNLIQQQEPAYIYPYVSHENERELCHMELRALFGDFNAEMPYIVSTRRLAPNRSPFISLRLDVLLVRDSLEGLLEQVGELCLEGSTFKVVYLKCGLSCTYEEQREAERQVGGRIRGKADMKNPDVTFGLLAREEGWTLGICHAADPVWLAHKHKPHNYSTGLTTVTARALVNIALPDPEGLKVIDPCCGMGNVLIEALSMGVDIVGRDINPVAIRGARSNLRHFGYDDAGVVAIQDLKELQGEYAAAIVDLPYNLCSVLPPEERRQMLDSIRRISQRAVIVSTEPLEEELIAAGFGIIDRCVAMKGRFARRIWLVHQ
ncbi:methyltransferase domain-containing protein [Paenibacillus senegalimassiliensis]|uniref:methyltransferase domain-containing protein n=1 Tax=Paenibacillus senegalimassiliensis TaxID=1737426 RepID=UPI00073F9E95|nr:methyltransferase domain-containing protein [Paenibacillus senegalimassiliensis]